MKSFNFQIVAILLSLTAYSFAMLEEPKLQRFYIVPLTSDKGPKPQGTVNSVAHCSEGGTAGTWRMEGCSGEESCRIEANGQERPIMLEFVPSAVYDSLTATYAISDGSGSVSHDAGPVSNSSVKANVSYAVRGSVKIGKEYAGRTIRLQFVLQSGHVKVICVRGWLEAY